MWRCSVLSCDGMIITHVFMQHTHIFEQCLANARLWTCVQLVNVTANIFKTDLLRNPHILHNYMHSLHNPHIELLPWPSALVLRWRLSKDSLKARLKRILQPDKHSFQYIILYICIIECRGIILYACIKKRPFLIVPW